MIGARIVRKIVYKILTEIVPKINLEFVPEIVQRIIEKLPTQTMKRSQYDEPDLNKSQKTRAKTPTASKVIP